jgi:hypothetical protein
MDQETLTDLVEVISLAVIFSNFYDKFMQLFGEFLYIDLSHRSKPIMCALQPAFALQPLCKDKSNAGKKRNESHT